MRRGHPVIGFKEKTDEQTRLLHLRRAQRDAPVQGRDVSGSFKPLTRSVCLTWRAMNAANVLMRLLGRHPELVAPLQAINECADINALLFLKQQQRENARLPPERARLANF